VVLRAGNLRHRSLNGKLLTRFRDMPVAFPSANNRRCEIRQNIRFSYWCPLCSSHGLRSHTPLHRRQVDLFLILVQAERSVHWVFPYAGTVSWAVAMKSYAREEMLSSCCRARAGCLSLRLWLHIVPLLVDWQSASPLSLRTNTALRPNRVHPSALEVQPNACVYLSVNTAVQMREILHWENSDC
jgi:hypothetical protein